MSCARCSSSGCSWSLRHAYENVPHYRRSSMRPVCSPADLRSLEDLARFPFTTKTDLRDNYPVRPVRRAARAGRAHSCLLRHHGQADRGGLHRAATSTPGPGSWRARFAPPAAGRATWCMSLMAMASSPAASARTTARSASAARSSRCPAGRPKGRCSSSRISSRDIIMVTPSYMLAIAEEFVRQGLDPRAMLAARSASSAPSRGPRRCARTIEQRARHRRGRHLRPVRSHGPGRRAGMRRDQGRAGDLGGSLLSRDHRPGDRRGAAGRRGGRAGVHLAHQGSAAGHPLSHAGSHAAAAADRALDAPHGEDHRPHGRHADHPRRECVSVADRGADAARSPGSRRTTSSR